MQRENLRLRALRVGALPILNCIIARMGLAEELTLALNNPGYAEALQALIKNILVERNALYAVGEWAALYDAGLVGQDKIGDDKLGRALDRLFAADRGQLADAHRPGGHERLRSQDGADPQRYHERHGARSLRRSKCQGRSAQARAQQRAPSRSQATGL